MHTLIKPEANHLLSKLELFKTAILKQNLVSVMCINTEPALWEK
jgi:hypothetical protein